MDEPPQPVALEPAALAGALFHNAADALLLVNPVSERILDANPAAVTLTGFDREQLLQLTLRGLIRHEQEWQDWNLGSPTGPPPSYHTFQMRTAQSDTWLPVSVIVTRLAAGTEPLALCRLRDRRDQIESQRRVQRAEAEQRRLLASLTEAVYIARLEPDGRWRIRAASPRFARLTGRPLPGPQDAPVARESAVLAEDLPRWQGLLACIASGQSGEIEYRLRRPDGSVIWVRESVAVFPENGGTVIHGTLSDITEHRRQEETPRSPDAARLEGMARLAGVVAHDFNNLLTAILGNVQLARLDSAPDALDRIEQVALRAVEQCLVLATLAGKATSIAGSTDLGALVRDTVANRRAIPGLRLVVEVPAEPATVVGDAAVLREMLGRLLDNAAEALNGKPGEVRVTVRLHVANEGESVLLRYPAELPTGPLLCLEVADTGAGFLPEARAHLGEPFFSTKPDRRGQGLALVAGVVRGLGGAIEALAPPEGGARFRVLLPQATVVEPAPAPPSVKAKSGTVLLIDDEPGVREVACRLMQALGYTVLPAADGEEGLELLRSHAGEVRLALVDWQMPGLAGGALITRLREVSPGLPIVVMSGESDHGQEAAKQGAYLQKPFRLPVLAELLRTMMGTE